MLTPETSLRLHLTKARELWLADRLDLADAAMRRALRVGFAPGSQYDLQRTIEAEYGARRAGAMWRLGEELIVEGAPARWERHWPAIVRELTRAMTDVTRTLNVRWGKPVLITLIPQDDWVEFMHARYGYYAERVETHKVCLPPTAIHPSEILRRAARHEIAHAAVHQLAGDGAPRWLDEGMAVTLEGGSPPDEVRRFSALVQKGVTMSLEQLSAGFESYDVEIGSPRSHFCYAASGAFVGRLAGIHGLGALRELLASIGGGAKVDRAFRSVLGQPLWRAEKEWWKTLTDGPFRKA